MTTPHCPQLFRIRLIFDAYFYGEDKAAIGYHNFLSMAMYTSLIADDITIKLITNSKTIKALKLALIYAQCI